MAQFVKCQFSQCQINAKVNKDEGICFKNKYYHKECFKIYQDILNIKDLCFQIDPTVPLKTLNIYLNKLIFEKKIDIDYINFTLEFILKNQIDVNLPFGLIYKLNDYKIKDEYKITTIKNLTKIHSS